MCIQYHLDNDYPNHETEVSFHYNYSSRDLELNNPVMASTSSWVMPHNDLGLQDLTLAGRLPPIFGGFAPGHHSQCDSVPVQDGGRRNRFLQ
jgi:hypothetical protein